MAHAVDMIGPAGPKGCSRMKCMKLAVSEYRYAIARINQPVYDVLYRFCTEHDHIVNAEHYPYFILKEHKAL